MTDNSLIPRSVDISHRTYPGNSYYEMISKTVTDKLGEPYNACEDNTNGLKSRLAKEIEARGSRYSQRLCFNLCILHYVEKECACSLEYQLWKNGSDTCRNECVRPILDLFEYHDKCKECALECDSVSFGRDSEKMLISGDEFFSNTVKETFSSSTKFSNLTLDYVLSNLIMINVKFEKIQYMQIEEAAKMSAASLIGELGGTLGNLNVICCRFRYLFKNIHFDYIYFRA